MILLSVGLSCRAGAAEPDFRAAYEREQAANKKALTTRLAFCYRLSALAIDQGTVETLGGLMDTLAQNQNRQGVRCVLDEVEPAVNRWLCANLPGKREDAAEPRGKECFLEVAKALEKAADGPTMPGAAPNRKPKPEGRTDSRGTRHRFGPSGTASSPGASPGRPTSPVSLHLSGLQCGHRDGGSHDPLVRPACGFILWSGAGRARPEQRASRWPKRESACHSKRTSSSSQATCGYSPLPQDQPT